MKDFLVMLATAAALVVCLIEVVDRRHAYYATAYDIARATAEQRALEDERRQLLIDRAALLVPGRLAPIAARHGFKLALADQLVLVGVAPAPPKDNPAADDQPALKGAP